MRPLNLRIPIVVLVIALSGCGSTELTRGGHRPSYARSADNHRSFETSGELAAYLRHDSEAGPLISAHRGGPAAGFPENAIATMDRSLRFAPALFEVDVRMSRDSVLVLMHDETLDRTTTGTGAVSSAALAYLRKLLLRDKNGVVTPFRVPTLSEALAWSEGRAVLTLDVKDSVSPKAVVDAIRQARAENRVVVIVYDMEGLLKYEQIAPDLNYSATAETMDNAEAILQSVVDKSHLIVWTGLNEVNDPVIAILHRDGIRAMVGTFEGIDEQALEFGASVYEVLLERGVDIIATDNVPLAADATRRWALARKP